MGYEYVEEPVVGAKIKVIGVGGGRGNAINGIHHSRYGRWNRYWCCTCSC